MMSILILACIIAAYFLAVRLIIAVNRRNQRLFERYRELQDKMYNGDLTAEERKEFVKLYYRFNCE